MLQGALILEDPSFVDESLLLRRNIQFLCDEFLEVADGAGLAAGYLCLVGVGALDGHHNLLTRHRVVDSRNKEGLHTNSGGYAGRGLVSPQSHRSGGFTLLLLVLVLLLCEGISRDPQELARGE